MRQTPSSTRLELLTSWKEIANFLGKGVRTVQRWEATLGLPVMRPADNRAGIVMARPSDLEAWVLNGRQHSHRNANDGQQMESAARITLAECVRELHRCHSEAKSLCDQVDATRQLLQHEIERLRLLYQEWVAIRVGVPRETGVPSILKVN
jgi:hypothetical protein